MKNTVRVYFNLHKKTFSVQTYVPGKGWRLSHHTDSIKLENATFKVYESGRKRAIAEGKKNVHAYVVGTMSDVDGFDLNTVDLQQVSYNPYFAGTFYDKQTKKPVANKDLVSMVVVGNQNPLIFAADKT